LERKKEKLRPAQRVKNQAKGAIKRNA